MRLFLVHRSTWQRTLTTDFLLKLCFEYRYCIAYILQWTSLPSFSSKTSMGKVFFFFWLPFYLYFPNFNSVLISNQFSMIYFAYRTFYPFNFNFPFIFPVSSFFPHIFLLFPFIISLPTAPADMATIPLLPEGRIVLNIHPWNNDWMKTRGYNYLYLSLYPSMLSRYLHLLWPWHKQAVLLIRIRPIRHYIITVRTCVWKNRLISENSLEK